MTIGHYVKMSKEEYRVRIKEKANPEVKKKAITEWQLKLNATEIKISSNDSSRYQINKFALLQQKKRISEQRVDDKKRMKNSNRRILRKITHSRYDQYLQGWG